MTELGAKQPDLADPGPTAFARNGVTEAILQVPTVKQNRTLGGNGPSALPNSLL